MTIIHISPELADKLNRLAEREHKTVDEVLERLLETETNTGAVDLNLPGGEALLMAVRKANIHSGSTDTAERSRDILDTEFANYLLTRMQGEPDQGSKK